MLVVIFKYVFILSFIVFFVWYQYKLLKKVSYKIHCPKNEWTEIINLRSINHLGSNERIEIVPKSPNQNVSGTCRVSTKFTSLSSFKVNEMPLEKSMSFRFPFYSYQIRVEIAPIEDVDVKMNSTVSLLSSG